MCGIVPFFSYRDPIADEILERATYSLRHRGHDGRGQWMSSDRRVALGHRRPGMGTTTGGAEGGTARRKYRSRTLQ